MKTAKFQIMKFPMEMGCHFIGDIRRSILEFGI